MNTEQREQLRPGFEAAIIERFKESGFLEVEIRVECLTRCGDSYDDSSVSIAWWAWCESRRTMVVELPSIQDININEYTSFETVGVCKEAIEAAGLKVKP